MDAATQVLVEKREKARDLAARFESIAAEMIDRITVVLADLADDDCTCEMDRQCKTCWRIAVLEDGIR